MSTASGWEGSGRDLMSTASGGKDPAPAPSPALTPAAHISIFEKKKTGMQPESSESIMDLRGGE